MLQMSGNDEIAQNDRRTRLSPGEICLVDGSLPFEIEIIGVSRVALFTFPQALAKSRLTHLLRQCVQKFGDHSAEFRVFRAAFLEAFSAAGALASNAATVVCESLISLFSVIPEPEPIDDNHRFTRSRIKQALHVIDSLIDDPNLSAASVAQCQQISRRRLDALFQKELGMTVAAQIMERRLAQAASDLCDPGKVSSTISEVAYGAGFKDPAHFTRAFTRRFGRTPSSWKQSVQAHQ
jgi:AraC-like DNA-binding protein